MQFGREWTKFVVRLREVSGLESVRLERVDCNTLLLIAYLKFANYIENEFKPAVSGERFYTIDAGTHKRLR